MSTLDIILFTVAVVAVIAFGIWKGTSGTSQGSGASGYFLAGRGLTWWLVGFSLIAANISTEQFVGMSGQAADWLGMAIASYEWMAAITLVVVAFVFLPAYFNGNITAQIATLTGCNAQSFIIKDSGNNTRWTVSYNTSTYAIEFKNASGVLECSIDQSGNLKAKGEVTAYATI